MDDELLERAKKGDESAIIAIYQKNKDILFAYVQKICRDDNIAEEIVSQTFEKFLTLLPTIKSGNLRGWLFIVARNVLRDFYREREKEISLTETNPFPSPEEMSYEKRDWEEINQALRELPKIYQEILSLYYLKGDSVEEIKKKTGKSESTIWQLLSRARKKLRKIVRNSPWLKKRYPFIGGKDEKK
jgi:RNA polymerase sigma-70 factor (ECF subfamily)